MYTIQAISGTFQAIADSSITQQHPLGTIIKAFDPDIGSGEFVYLKAKSANALNQAVYYDAQSFSAGSISPKPIGSPALIAVPAAANAEGAYGWYQTTGFVSQNTLSSPGNSLIQEQSLVASYGDSIANITGSTTAYDLRQISGNIGFDSARVGFGWPASVGGLVRFVANGGISGETTTQMMAREIASATTTRKSISDIASCGAKYVYNSMGLNDIQQLAGSSTQAQIDTVVSTTLGNILFLLRRQVSIGLWPFTPCLFGYALTTATASEIQVRVSAIQALNVLLKAEIEGADGALGSYVDVYSQITDTSGAWLPGLDQGDGVHPGINGVYVICQTLADEWRRVSGILSTPLSVLPVNPISANTNNIVTNNDFTTSAGGLATGVTSVVAVGTMSNVNSIVYWRGRNWQEVVATALTLDGNGNAAWQLDIAIPTATLSTGLPIIGEFDLYIDSGNFEIPPPVFQWATRIRGTSVIHDNPTFQPTISPKIDVDHNIDYHAVVGPIIEPSGAPNPSVLSVIVFVNAVGKRVRIRVALPRVAVMPSGGASGFATLVAGTVTIPYVSLAYGSRITLTTVLAGGTQGALYATPTPGTGFVITSTSATDTSRVKWEVSLN